MSKEDCVNRIFDSVHIIHFGIVYYLGTLNSDPNMIWVLKYQFRRPPLTAQNPIKFTTSA